MKPPQRDSDLSEDVWPWVAGFLQPAGIAIISLVISGPPTMVEGAPPALHTKEYTITIDATELNPPTWWQVPGVTTMIMTMDPDSTEAFKTTVPHDLKLNPGSYRFGTFTFDFPFMVTLEGVLDFAPSLDQCVSGRGTRRLAIRCSRTQPYGGQPDY
jgi:hypothetical protein